MLQASLYRIGFRLQQGHGDYRGANRLPQSPAISRRRHHEYEEKKERPVLRRREQRNQDRPDDIDRMHNQAESSRRLRPETQQQHHHHRMRQVDNQQPVQPARIYEAALRLYPQGKFGGDGQRDPRRCQPTLGAPDFART